MRKRLSITMATVGMVWLVAAAPVLAATIFPTDETPVGATLIAEAIATPSFNMIAAEFQTAPPAGDPNGWADAPINVFPTNGSTFGILTSGEVALADDPNSSGSSGTNDGGLSPPGRGTSAFDVSVLQIQFEAPASANCLTFDFKFFSEEYPEWVGSDFNDAFIAELDTSTWTTTDSNITAPDNFAFDQDGDEISINSAFFSAGNAAGTTYDGATVLLSASTEVTPGVHTLYLSIFDQGDPVLDSAVFLDNLRVGFVPDPAVNCAPGAQVVNFQMALEPAEDENPVGTPHTVTATLTDEDGDPVAGATIDFDVTGANTAAGADTTDANGQAEFTYTGASAGDDTITACYNADASADGSCEAVASATKHWVGAGPPATLDLEPATATNTVDDEHCVTATATDEFGNPTPGVTVEFSVSGPGATEGSAVTNDDGEAEFCYTSALPGEDEISAFADTDGSGTQDPGEPSDTATKTWVLPASTAGCKVTYGGWITAANGDRANFGGNAKADDLKGQQEYQDHGPAADMNVHSIDVLAVTCSEDGTQASIFGTATVDGEGSFDYRIDLKDLGDTGTDTYRIRLSNAYDSGEQPLEGGNVQIH